MKRTKLKLYAALAALGAFAALAPVTMIRAQSGDVAAAITKLENDGVKADLAGDKSFTEKYVADDWVGCDSSGKWFTKPEVLKMIADPKNNKYNSEKLSDLKVRVYANGNTALATYTDSYDAVVAGEHRTRTILTTDVWVKIGSDWKQVSSHSTTKKQRLAELLQQSFHKRAVANRAAGGSVTGPLLFREQWQVMHPILGS